MTKRGWNYGDIMNLSEMAIKRLKEVHKLRIDQELEKALEKEREFMPFPNPLFLDAVEKLKDFNLRGGKRLRPAFLVEGYRCVGGKDLDSAYQASIAIEGSETYLLIHDDVIDEDALRRGKPTVHKMYSADLERFALPEAKRKHISEGLAMVLGDVQATINYDWFLKPNFPTGLKVKAIQHFNEILRLTCYGQILDVMSETKPAEEVTEEDVITIHRLKTSAYTIYGPLQIGAILGGASEDELKIFYEYGDPLGVAFQLQDDILGTFGDPKKTGKPVHSDLKEGKRTLLIVKALENADDHEKRELLAFLGKRDLTDKEADTARGIIKETGSLEYSREMAKRLADQSLKAVENADFVEEGKEYLIGIAEYLINRDV